MPVTVHLRSKIAKLNIADWSTAVFSCIFNFVKKKKNPTVS